MGITSMESNQILSLTILPDIRQMICNGQLLMINDDQFQELLNVIPEFWHTDNDKISIFRCYEDGSYHCERRKNIYNYSTKEWEERVYLFDAAPENYVNDLRDILLSFYQSIKLKDIQNINDEIVNNIENISYIKNFLLETRYSLLSQSDYIFMPDYPISEEDKKKWADYRQELRDITNQEAWKNDDYINIDMPVAPDPKPQASTIMDQLKRYDISIFENVFSDVDLESSGKWNYKNIENYVTKISQLIIKSSIIRSLSKLDLPSLNFNVRGIRDAEKAFEAANPNIADEVERTLNNFKNLVDNEMKKIDSSLTFNDIITEMIEKSKQEQIDQEILDIIDELEHRGE